MRERLGVSPRAARLPPFERPRPQRGRCTRRCLRDRRYRKWRYPVEVDATSRRRTSTRPPAGRGSLAPSVTSGARAWGSAGDGAAFVEAMYRLDLPDEDWFGEMWRGLAALTPGARALMAGRYLWDASRRVFTFVDAVGSDPDVVAHLRAAQNRADATSMSATVGGATRVFTFVDAVGPKLRATASAVIMRELGVADVLNLSAWVERSGTRQGVCISAGSVDAAIPMSAGRRAIWERFAGHLSAAARLRGQAASSVECVLDGTGRIHDAAGAAKPRSARDALVRAARAIERARLRDRRTDVSALLDAWRAIYERRWTLVETVERDGRRLLLARVNPPQEHGVAGASPAERQVAALLALGVPQKVIAFELQRSPSTVAGHVRNLARRFGVSTVPELVVRLRDSDASRA